MKISYAITVCNEHKEIERLLAFLFEHKRQEDQYKYPDATNPGTNYKYRMDMKNLKRFDKLCFMDAAEELGMFAKPVVNESEDHYVAKVLSGSKEHQDGVMAVHKGDCEELHLGSYTDNEPITMMT